MVKQSDSDRENVGRLWVRFPPVAFPGFVGIFSLITAFGTRQKTPSTRRFAQIGAIGRKRPNCPETPKVAPEAIGDVG